VASRLPLRRSDPRAPDLCCVSSAAAQVLRALRAAASPTSAVAALAAGSAAPHRRAAEGSHETRACSRQRKRSLADHGRTNRVAVAGQPLGVH
jgi:hypothetical protein